MRTRVAVFLWICAAVLRAEVPCPCNPHDPDSLKERQCSLCAQAEKAPPSMPVVFVRDSSPLKPDRWLALPRSHSPGMHHMSALTAAERIELWRQAIARGKELWGDQWALGYNAERFHSQCHVHVHIGKLLDGVEWGAFQVVDGPEEIPLPGDDGLWIHPVNGKLHVHLGEPLGETVLLR